MWQAYLGNTNPVSLFNRFRTKDAWECARRAAEELPSLYGILRRRSWKDSFQPGPQYTREMVCVGLFQHLEDTREDWEPSLPQVFPAFNDPPPTPVVLHERESREVAQADEPVDTPVDQDPSEDVPEDARGDEEE